VVMGTRKCQNSNLRKIEQGKILLQIPINHGTLQFKLLLETVKPLRFLGLCIKLHIIAALLVWASVLFPPPNNWMAYFCSVPMNDHPSFVWRTSSLAKWVSLLKCFPRIAELWDP
jgi:hypothetical protein